MPNRFLGRAAKRQMLEAAVAIRRDNNQISLQLSRGGDNFLKWLS